MRFQPSALGSVHNLAVSTGVKISYLDTGEIPGAPTLLFLHGLATYGLSWRPNIEVLKNKYRCIAIDLPGYGHSSHGDLPYTMSFFAHSVIDFIGQLRLDNVCLVGHSMGGQIAMNALLEEPRCAHHLVLCATAGFESFSPLEKAAYMASVRALDFFSDDETSLKQGLYSSFYRFPPEAEGMVQDLVTLFRRRSRESYKQTIDRSIQGMIEGDVFSRLPQVRQPALVIFGEEDALIPAKFFSRKSTKQIAKDGAERLRNAELHVFPKAGHFVHWEKGTAVKQLIDGWLQQNSQY